MNPFIDSKPRLDVVVFFDITTDKQGNEKIEIATCAVPTDSSSPSAAKRHFNSSIMPISTFCNGWLAWLEKMNDYYDLTIWCGQWHYLHHIEDICRDHPECGFTDLPYRNGQISDTNTLSMVVRRMGMSMPTDGFAEDFSAEQVASFMAVSIAGAFNYLDKVLERATSD